MSFDVPKVVRSPRCDHGHDEESRNGREMKMDIYIGRLCLDTGMVSGSFRHILEYRGVTGTP